MTSKLLLASVLIILVQCGEGTIDDKDETCKAAQMLQHTKATKTRAPPDEEPSDVTNVLEAGVEVAKVEVDHAMQVSLGNFKVCNDICKTPKEHEWNFCTMKCPSGFVGGAPKSLFLSYWDQGDCGRHGDDWHADWCGWGGVGSKCKEKKPHWSPWCSDNKMEIESANVPDWWEPWHFKVGPDRHNCRFAYKVQFKCGGSATTAKVLQIGSYDECAEKSGGTCCVKPQQKLKCNRDAGNEGIRVNSNGKDFGNERLFDTYNGDPKSAKFDVVHKGDKVCVTRTDATGWKMRLQLACMPE